MPSPMFPVPTTLPVSAGLSLQCPHPHSGQAGLWTVFTVLWVMSCHLSCLLLAAASGELKVLLSAGFVECLSVPTFCSFKKRRGHSVGGAPEQRYQSIPVCVSAQIPSRAQDVLVRKELGHMPEVLIGMFRGGSSGPEKQRGRSLPSACGEIHTAFYSGTQTRERVREETDTQHGAWGTGQQGSRHS